MRLIFLLIYPGPQIYIAHQMNPDERDKVEHTEAECDNARIEQHDARWCFLNFQVVGPTSYFL